MHNLKNTKKILLFSGIANSYPLIDYLRNNCQNLEVLCFPDHHDYAPRDMVKIKGVFDNMLSKAKIIVTTQKDVMRLEDPGLIKMLEGLPVYYIPIEIRFHFEDNVIFDARIQDYVKTHQSSHEIPPG